MDLAINAHTTAVLASVGAPLEAIGASLERMIQTQMTAYPDAWSEEDRRDAAERHLFRKGRK